MTSPDTSAAEVVARRFRWLRQDGTPTASGEWHLAKERPPLLPSVANIEELVLKSTLDASRAETAAASARIVALERDLRDALAVAEPWHKAYETQLALADLLDSNVASLGKQLADEGRAREVAEAKLTKVKTIKETAAGIENMAAMRVPGDARDAISRLTVIEADAARILRLCALTEIEGKSK